MDARHATTAPRRRPHAKAGNRIIEGVDWELVQPSQCHTGLAHHRKRRRNIDYKRGFLGIHAQRAGPASGNNCATLAVTSSTVRSKIAIIRDP